MQRAIARQAEAERERRAKIIHAEGEFQASAKLAEAAAVLEKQPAAIQLRYLQTMTEIGVEKNTTIVFPLPVDIIIRLGQAEVSFFSYVGPVEKACLAHHLHESRRKFVSFGLGKPDWWNLADRKAHSNRCGWTPWSYWSPVLQIRHKSRAACSWGEQAS